MIQAFARMAQNTESIPVRCDRTTDAATFSIPAKSIPVDAKTVEIALSFMSAPAGSKGYYVIPTRELCFLTRFTEREDTVFQSSQIIMPMLGYQDGNDAYLVCVDGMRYSYTLQLQVKDGQYSVALIYDLEKTSFYEDAVLSVYRLPGAEADYNTIAKKYQEIQIRRNHLLPLSERMKTSEVLQYALDGMPVIRVRMGWKPVPTPVLEQTPENEPPMHVACTFAQVEELMVRLHKLGLQRAEFCLVGWNYRGHDGRWPQMLPVEPALGGEEGLKKLIAHAKQLGFRVVFHTNSSDAYRVSELWDEDDIVRKKNGELSINDETWSGGRMYHLCPKQAEEKYLPDVLTKLKELGAEGFSYIDVLTINSLKECFHPAHPSNAEQSRQHLCEILQKMRKTAGGVASEGGFDFAADSLDYSLYIGFNILDGMPDVCDEVIPLWQLVYHGYILSNPSAETVNFCVKEPKDRLRFYEYGGVPTIYYYSKFVGEQGRVNWMGQRDMLMDDEATLSDSTEKLAAMMAEYRPFAARQLAFMERHEKLAEGVYQTTYSDGYAVVCNYTDEPFAVGSVVVPAKDVRQLRL